MVQPRQDRRWTRRKEARPAELISAALDLFVERGFSATRLEDVATRAGVSKGTLYLYFPSKEELFKAVVRAGIVPAIERAEKLLDEHRGSASTLICDMVKGWWVSVGSTRLGGIPKLMISESRNFPELTQFYYREVISRVHRLVAAAVQRGIESGEFRPVNLDYVKRLVIAPLWLLTVWRFSFDYCESQKLDPCKYLDSHLDLILRGLENDEGVRLSGAETSDMKSPETDSIYMHVNEEVPGASRETRNVERGHE
jgi:AcrR family transcriptional regulator